ncbi:MAG TPA: PD-(D/E)XK nuclease family protein [Patescibacteria group bacterium]|nr:PD-(D/E)XK nuclease family protein [Patescibacteria group bacterium]
MVNNEGIKISATRISTFLQCKQKYWFNYYDKLPKIDNPVFKLGTAVHIALELAGNIWREKEKFTKKDKETIINKFKEVSVKEGIDDFSVHQTGIELVTNRINDFIHEGHKIISLETPFGYKGGVDVITKEGVPLLGAIDKVLQVDEDTILIVDYKTSKTAPTPDQLKTDKQLSMYDLVASILWPGKRIIVSLDLLKHEMLYSYRTPEERAAFSEYLRLVYDSMLSLKEQDVKATINTFCPWCDFREYCNAYKEAYTNSNGKFQEAYRLDNSALVDEWQQVKKMKKIYEMREKELSLLLMDRIKTTGINVQVDDKEVYVRQNSRATYDISAVKQIVPQEYLLNMVSLNKSDIEKYMDKNPAAKAKIVDSMTVNFTTPFLDVRKIKNK